MGIEMGVGPPAVLLIYYMSIWGWDPTYPLHGHRNGGGTPCSITYILYEHMGVGPHLSLGIEMGVGLHLSLGTGMGVGHLQYYFPTTGA